MSLSQKDKELLFDGKASKELKSFVKSDFTTWFHMEVCETVALLGTEADTADIMIELLDACGCIAKAHLLNYVKAEERGDVALTFMSVDEMCAFLAAVIQRSPILHTIFDSLRDVLFVGPVDEFDIHKVTLDTWFETRSSRNGRLQLTNIENLVLDREIIADLTLGEVTTGNLCMVVGNIERFLRDFC
jgi:hypothetical protein